MNDNEDEPPRCVYLVTGPITAAETVPQTLLDARAGWIRDRAGDGTLVLSGSSSDGDQRPEEVVVLRTSRDELFVLLENHPYVQSSHLTSIMVRTLDQVEFGSSLR